MRGGGPRQLGSGRRATSLGVLALAVALAGVDGAADLRLPAPRARAQTAEGGEGDEAAPAPSPEADDPPNAPRYVDAIRGELEALRLAPRCRVQTRLRGSCRWTVEGRRSGRDFDLEVVYDDGTDTAYLFVGRYLEAPAEHPRTPALLTRLMELNWRLLVGKLEWNPTDGEVRLSAIVNTDSNFDRRAFRSTVRAVGSLADRHHAELAGILDGTDGDDGDR